mmetsp:Transcript_35712/g.114921  ORF Transcript_35712/g.114921 Transcript_35712/m.114921 type:complete len:297 (-) Transcript_35712:90-980(-)
MPHIPSRLRISLRRKAHDGRRLDPLHLAGQRRVVEGWVQNLNLVCMPPSCRQRRAHLRVIIPDPLRRHRTAAHRRAGDGSLARHPDIDRLDEHTRRGRLAHPAHLALEVGAGTVEDQPQHAVIVHRGVEAGLDPGVRPAVGIEAGVQVDPVRVVVVPLRVLLDLGVEVEHLGRIGLAAAQLVPRLDHARLAGARQPNHEDGDARINHFAARHRLVQHHVGEPLDASQGTIQRRRRHFARGRRRQPGWQFDASQGTIQRRRWRRCFARGRRHQPGWRGAQGDTQWPQRQVAVGRHDR